MHLTFNSYYSLRYGTIPVDKIPSIARKAGADAVLLTDINNSTGIIDFVKACNKEGIKPIAGMEFHDGNRWLYTGIAENNEGFRELNDLMSRSNLQHTALPCPAPPFRDVLVIYPFGSRKTTELAENEYIGIAPSDVTKLPLSDYTKYPGKYIIHSPASFTDEPGYELHRYLRAIDNNILLTRLTPEMVAGSDRMMKTHKQLADIFANYKELIRNTERITGRCAIAFDFTTIKNKKTFTGSGHDDRLLLEKLALDGLIYRYGKNNAEAKRRVRHELADIFANYKELIRNTERITGRCAIAFDFTTIKNKKTFTGSGHDDRLLLEKLALDGLIYRYGKNNAEAKRRVRHELDIIDSLGFCAYFLITWDIIRYSMSRGFYHVGRGSGANSVVAYCLRITDVDPIELNLYFERFLNPKRSSPPDFDIDYSWKDRDEVLDYIFKRYGREHTALLGATSTFKGKSIIRELGKVVGLPKGELDKLVESPPPVEEMDHISRKIMEIGTRMTDFPNIRSIHAGGVLISEKPITYYSALDLPPKSMPVTQWDMYVAEDLGFEKLDILSQRGLGHIKEGVEIIKENRGVSIDIHQVQKFKADAEVRRLLSSGETTGCFYIESPGMRGLITKLRCEDYITLVAASSIIRPGVAKSGMMREFIVRFHNPNGFEYIHPIMKEQLSETYGVMVYQEDVLKICHHFAGLDLADADVLRRAMSGKYRSRVEFQKIVDKFFDNCRQQGHPEAITKEVWRQIESFAGYSFSKAHSASFAVESYQSLYLKAYYPIEFMVAVANNFGGFYQSWVYFNEAKRWGAELELPCINNGKYLNCVTGKTIYIGMVHISGLESTHAHNIFRERDENGPYTGLDDFVQRVNPQLEQAILLIRTGAFRFTGYSKQQLLWQAHMMLGKTQKVTSTVLFREGVKNWELPQFVHDPVEDAYDEMELLDFPVSMSYFDMLKTKFRGEILASGLKNQVGQQVRMAGALVTIKYVRTVKKEIMQFVTFIDNEGEFFDVVMFPDVLKQYPTRGRGVYLILGKVTDDFGYPSVDVQRMAKLPPQADPRYK